MTVDPKKRQKTLAKKKAKRKVAVAAKGFAHFKQTASGIIRAIQAPIHECYLGKTIFENGMGTVVISRKVSNNEIGLGVFLIDAYCLGVKNCFFTLLNNRDYSMQIDTINKNEGLETIHPSCARKLIEQGVEYAKDLGFKPNKDYSLAKKIFGDIDPEVCPRKFEFGKDGKPFYISGPQESSGQIKKIIKQLMTKCGEGNFDVMIRQDTDELDDFFDF